MLLQVTLQLISTTGIIAYFLHLDTMWLIRSAVFSVLLIIIGRATWPSSTCVSLVSIVGLNGAEFKYYIKG